MELTDTVYTIHDLGKTHKSILLREMFFCTFRGVAALHKNFSQILAIIDFSSREIARKTLSVRKNIIGNINLGQTSR